MAEPTAHEPLQPPDGETGADSRMAGILRGDSAPRGRLRDELRDEGSGDSDDILGRLNALDFIDGVVGEVTDLPERLGEYRIHGLLGRGGMGTVYEAFQESLERDVALKVLSPAYSADVTMRERFRSEARRTASLHHEHIVPVYDFGETGGVLYFAMEKVDGVSLDRHISASKRVGKPAFEPLEAAARFAGVAEALHHAHRRRILHRDVKPGNLLVAQDGTFALADFGLSKIVGEHSRSLTAAGAFLGTPAYAPPEQTRGADPSPASDLYGLGVTMFEAVTGELPLEGKTTEALIDAVLNSSPKRLRQIMPRAPKDLEAVIDKLLQKEPQDRYSDGEELARDLRRIAEGESVTVRRQPLYVRAWRKAKRNPVLTATVLLASILAVVTLVLVVINRIEHGKSMDAQHTNTLQSAISLASRESGSAMGPPGLLQSLAGIELTVGAPGTVVLAKFADAEAILPGNADTQRLRDAYLQDPLPEATSLLMAGSGHAAKRLLDPEIEAARAGFEARDEATLLRLYRLYLSRAVACLTESVADRDQARMDLFASSFIRSGAFFPKLLLCLVEWTPAEGAEGLIAEIRGLVESGPEGARVVAGVLVRAMAGVGRAKDCNLVRFEASQATRTELHREAMALLGDIAPRHEPAATLWWTGMEARVAGIAAKAAPVFGDKLPLLPLLDEGRRLLDEEVAPSSPLQSWRFVFELIGNVYPDESRDPEDAVTAERMVDGWINLLRLEPPSGLFAEGLDVTADRILERYPDTPRAAELRSMLALNARSPDEIVMTAREWYRSEPDHPGALINRFRGLVLQRKVLEAAVCGAEFVQNAIDRQRAIDLVVRVLKQAESRDGNSVAWTPVRTAFEQAED